MRVRVGSQIFIVAELCKKNEIVVQPPEDFSKDVNVYTPGFPDFVYQNSYASQQIATGRGDRASLPGTPDPPPNDIYSLWGFDMVGLWPQNSSNVSLNSAEIQIKEHSKSGIGSQSLLHGKLITQPWVEANTVYDNLPSYSSTFSVTYSNLGSTGAQFSVLSELQTDGEVSYLNSIEHIGSQGLLNNWSLHSGSSSSVSDRPKLTLNVGEVCQFIPPKRKLDAQYYVIEDNLLKVRFDQSYTDLNGDLNYLIYSENRSVVQDGVIEPVNSEYGFNEYFVPIDNLSNNHFTFEVKDEKGEVHLIRFKKD